LYTRQIASSFKIFLAQVTSGVTNLPNGWIESSSWSAVAAAAWPTSRPMRCSVREGNPEPDGDYDAGMKAALRGLASDSRMAAAGAAGGMIKTDHAF